MAEINYINGYEIADAQARTNSSSALLKATQALTKANNNGNAIENLEGEITGLSSGSPLIASSTADMTDTTRIYVNTTDGKWYYYDGDSWEIGGVYQSTQLPVEVQNKLNSVYSEVNNIEVNPSIEGFVYYSDGTFSNSSSARRTGYVIIDGYDKLEYNTKMGTTGASIAFYDINKTYMSEQSIQGTNATDFDIESIPENAYYAILSVYGAENFSTAYIKCWKNNSIKEQVSKNNLTNSLLKNELTYLYKPTLEGYVVYSTGVPNTASSARHTDYIDLSGFTHFICNSNLGDVGASVAFYDESKSFLQEDSIMGASRNLEIIAIPNSAKYAILSTYGSAYFDTSFLRLFILNNDKVFKTPIFNKNILIFGDSITDCCNLTINSDKETTAYTWRNPSNSYIDENSNTISYSMWPKLIRDNYFCKEIRNYAKSGASYIDQIRTAGNERQNLSYQIDVALNDINNPNNVFNQSVFTPDIIIFALGTNDGYANDTYESAMAKTIYQVDKPTSINVEATINNLDLTKFNESARCAFLRVKQQWPMAQIFVVLPIQRADRETLNTNEYLRKMALRYGAIIIDGSGNTGIIREFNTFTSTGIYLKDGLHPNEKGQNLMTRLIVSSLLNNYIDFSGMNSYQS